MQGTSMTNEQRRLVEEEDKYRQLFAENPSSQELSDPHLLLEDVFSLDPRQWTFQDEDADEKCVPKLLEQKRTPVFGRAIVDTKAQFLTNWETFTKGMFKGLKWDNIFIAGGAVLACLQPDFQAMTQMMTKYHTSDIDIFVHGIEDDEQANALLRHIHSVIKTNTQGEGIVIRTRRTVTIINSYPYRHTQVILRLYKSPAQVLLGFDVDCCTFGFDGNTVWAMERGRRALTKRYNLVNPSRRSLTYESRLFKYSGRGFAVAVPNLDKMRVNQKLFGPTSTPSQFQGLAKLLVYDHRVSNPAPFFSRRGKSREDADQAKSDYDGDLVIPWGPGLTAAAILNRLNATDKSQFFANKMKDLKSGNSSSAATHKHLFVPGLDDLIQGQFWCSTCAKQVELPEEEPLGIFVQRKVEWERNALAYQDVDHGFKRALFTGSFQVKLNDDWTLGAYQDGPTSSQGATAVQPHMLTPKKAPASSFSFGGGAQKKPEAASPTRSPAKGPSWASPGALPSFASSYTQQAPSPAKKKEEAGPVECEVCGSSFLSQNQLLRHVRVTGHVRQEPGTFSLPSLPPTLQVPSASSYTSPPNPYAQSVYAASPPRSPAPVTIPISPSQIYSKPTPLDLGPGASSSASSFDLSQFGPQPGTTTDFFFTSLPSASSSSSSSSASHYDMYSCPPTGAAQPASVSYGVPSSPSPPSFGFGTTADQAAPGELPWAGHLVQEEMTKAFLLLGWLKRQNKITDEEKTVLKRLAIQENDIIMAAVQVYEIEKDVDDLVNTLQALVAHYA